MRQRLGLALAGIAWLLAAAGAAGPAAATTYHADPERGDDAGEGTPARPWRSLAASIPRLRPGDSLVLRGGTYFESGVRIDVAGLPDAPIEIRSHPGEVAVVDGGFREFRRPGNADWEVVDADRGIYRSTRAYPRARRVHAYLRHAGRSYHLVPYERLGHLVTANQRASDGDVYVGQGLAWSPSDGRIYVRLVPGELQELLGYEGPPRLDPRDAELSVFGDGAVVTFGPGAAHVVWDGVGVAHRNQALEFASASHHVTVRNAALLGGRTHVMIRDGAHDLLFDGVEILDSVPRWIAWKDVKSASKPAHGLQGAAFAIEGASHHVEIRNSRIEGSFDAVDATGSPHHLHVHHNVFRWIRDDVLQLGSSGHHYHVHHNLMAPVSKGVSAHGSGSAPQPGTFWIHHNVIDTSEPMQHGRLTPQGTWTGKGTPGSQGRARIRPFGRHQGSGFGAGDAWKIYQNTLVFGRDANGWGAGHARPRREGAVHEVYNNVFVQIEDHWIAREATSAGGAQIYDGNLYHRRVAKPSQPLFRRFGGAGGGDFASLAELLGSRFQAATRSFYGPGWESGSVQADPLLDDHYRPAADGPAATGAVALPRDFPGLDGGSYRGALPPAAGPAPDRPSAAAGSAGP